MPMEKKINAPAARQEAGSHCDTWQDCAPGQKCDKKTKTCYWPDVN